MLQAVLVLGPPPAQQPLERLPGDLLAREADAVLITVAAMVGKWACGLVTPRGISGRTVGLGMMPRSEVGLIFAGIGASLALDGKPVVSPETYVAAVFMVVVTTMATPPLLLWSLRRDGGV